MITTLKRLIYSIIISFVILWIWPYIYFYFKPSSNTLAKTQIFNNNSSKNYSADLNPKLISKIIITPNIWANSFTIDKGSLDGVLFGGVITNSNGQVLGVITRVDSNTSLVKTITNPETRLAVWVGKSSNKGLLSGLYGYSAEVDWIQDNTELLDQPVYTSNYSKNTKEGLYVGRVQDVRLGKSGSFYAASLNDLTNIWQTDGSVLVW